MNNAAINCTLHRELLLANKKLSIAVRVFRLGLCAALVKLTRGFVDGQLDYNTSSQRTENELFFFGNATYRISV